MKTIAHSIQPSPRATAPSKYRAPTIACLVGAGTLILASCAEYPIAVAVQGDHGAASYSAKQGLIITYQK